MRVYLAGPITGHESTYRETFRRAAEELRAKGLTVLNPAELPDGLEYDQYIHIGLAMLDVCDAILMLKGWESSRGATHQRAIAAAAKKIIMNL